MELAYLSIYQDIRDKMSSGEYPKGSVIPREHDLMQIYQVSRNTVRKAMKMLQEEGYVEIRQGSGTIVLDRKATQFLNRVTSFTETLTKKGYKVTSPHCHVDRIKPKDEVRAKLKLSESDEIIRVQRVQYADDEPVCVMVNYIPAELAPDMDKRGDKIIALYQYLEETYGILVEYTEDTISAVGADFMMAMALEREAGFPLMRVVRVCYDNKNRPLCLDVVHALSDRYDVRIRCSGRDK